MNLKELVADNRSGHAKALPSFCTANQYVLEDILNFVAARNLPVLIEATCNQVNQFGGYTGMKPFDYAAKIRKQAQDLSVNSEQLILGGDHLGPNPWKDMDASEAMIHAKALVKDYVEAGFTKIHLDASMACGGEPTPSFELVAERSAELCVIAEQYAPNAALLSYVIGTEVPVPGGESDDMTGIQVTTPGCLTDTIETHETALKAAGVEHALERVIAAVVQPGVDFSHEGIYHYDRDASKGLVHAIRKYDGLGYEAHSTDYQSTKNLQALVEDHSVVLKVGPELTFRFREGMMALDHIEDVLQIENPANVIARILGEMQKHPANWSKYYDGTEQEIEFLKIYSYSDRIRYYWDQPNVVEATKRLLAGLEKSKIRAAISSQFGVDFPIETSHVEPRALITQRVISTIERYYQACGWV